MFVVFAGLLLVTIASAASPSPAPQCSGSSPVVIIGAGLAGLSAADALRRFGCSSIVIEARDRIGGRCYTFPSSHAFAGQDVGAHWMHGGNDNPILKTLTTALSVTTIDVGNGDFDAGTGTMQMFDFDGTRMSTSFADNSFKLFDKQSDKLEDYNDERLDNDLPDVSVQDGIDHLAPSAGYTDQQARAVALQQSAEYDTAAGADAAHLGLNAMVNDPSNDYEGDEDEGGDRVYQGGCTSLITGLSRDLDIRLSTTVSKIERSSSGEVLVHTSGGVLTASKVLVTIPIAPLKQNAVQFSPALSSSWTAAAAQVDLGNVVKIMLKFSTAFWPSNIYIFTYMSGVGSLRGRYPYWVNTNFEGLTDNVLVCFVGGESANALSSLTDNEIKVQALDVLRLMFGTSVVTAPTAVYVTRFASDNTTRGAWSYIGVGGRNSAMETLAQPMWNGALMFAGEHTCRMMYGTVHAAVTSGLREAYRLINVSKPEETWSMMKYREYCEVEVDAGSALTTMWSLVLAASVAVWMMW